MNELVYNNVTSSRLGYGDALWHLCFNLLVYELQKLQMAFIL